MRGDFLDEGRRFEDIDKAVLRSIEGSTLDLRNFKEWVKIQSPHTLVALLVIVNNEILERGHHA